MKTVYIEHASSEYKRMFNSMGFTIVTDFNEASLICFTGGADVSPAYYGEKPHPQTHSDAWRDAKEERLFNEAVRLGIPCVGICRGGQFLNVMNGGKMYQHVSKHCGDHLITDARTGETLWVSSTHHQMMRPTSEAVLVAFASLGGTVEHMDGEVVRRDISKTDIEVVYYPATRSLCFQPHPEFAEINNVHDRSRYANMLDYFQRIVDEFLG